MVLQKYLFLAQTWAPLCVGPDVQGRRLLGKDLPGGKVAKGMKSGTMVVLLRDRGDRYLSTKLFMSTCACCPP